MREKYKFKVDDKANHYIKLPLKCNYYKREVICSMKGYVAKALEELEHISKDTFVRSL